MLKTWNISWVTFGPITKHRKTDHVVLGSRVKMSIGTNRIHRWIFKTLFTKLVMQFFYMIKLCLLETELQTLRIKFGFVYMFQEICFLRRQRPTVCCAYKKTNKRNPEVWLNLPMLELSERGFTPTSPCIHAFYSAVCTCLAWRMFGVLDTLKNHQDPAEKWDLS